MHRTVRVPRLILWVFLTTLTLFSGAGTAAAQEAPGKSLVVPLNITKTVALPGNRLLKMVKIENPTIADAEVNKADAKTVLITGKTPGLTRMQVVDVANQTENYELIVQGDVEYLKYMLRRAIPTANIEPIPSGGSVILSGSVAKPEDIPIIKATAQSVLGPQPIIDAMRVGGVQQVQLDVVIAQVSRTELRRMSTNFFRSGKNLLLTSELVANTLSAQPPIANLPNDAGLNANPANLVLGVVTANTSFFLFLEALRTEGLAKFLAEPRLITLSGQPATFLSGGRLAVPEPSGLGTNSVRFESFGTELRFVPIVLGNGKIYLQVEPKVNNRNDANGTTIGGTFVPGFDTQQVFTTVELEPGQTFAIGGLIQTSLNNTTVKVPCLGDLPFVGTAFRVVQSNFQETELLILVTPHLVDGMTCTQLPKFLPGQETRNADDFELFLEGILEAPRGPRQVCKEGRIYQAAWFNGPTAGQFPCGMPDGNYGHGFNHGASGCSPQPGGVSHKSNGGGVPVNGQTTPASPGVSAPGGKLPATPAPVPATKPVPAATSTIAPVIPVIPPPAPPTMLPTIPPPATAPLTVPPTPSTGLNEPARMPQGAVVGSMVPVPATLENSEAIRPVNLEVPVRPPAAIGPALSGTEGK